MVSSIILSRYQDGLNPNATTRQKIVGGPLYPVADVLPLLKPETVLAWTKGCIADLQKWSLDSDSLVDLLKLALSKGRYKGYTVMERRFNENTYKHQDTEFYLKFAINKTGQVILVVSSHPSDS
jgi:hypothetical protein